jgi:hypothetical protein
MAETSDDEPLEPDAGNAAEGSEESELGLTDRAGLAISHAFPTHGLIFLSMSS